MFDTVHSHHHTHHGLPSYPTKVDVTIKEHRAPTDESVKLLKELEDKALSRILGTLKLESTPFDCRVYPMLSVLGDGIKFVVLYKIGALGPFGRAWDMDSMQRLEHEVSTWDKPSMDKIVESLLDALAKDIAKTMLLSVAEPLSRSLSALPIR